MSNKSENQGNLIPKMFIEASPEALVTLAEKAKEQNTSQWIAKQILPHDADKVIEVLKALHDINYLELIDKTTKHKVIDFILKQKGVVGSKEAKKAYENAIKYLDDIDVINTFSTNGMTGDTIKLAIDAKKIDLALELVQNGTNVTTDHFLSVSVEDMLQQHNGVVKRSLTTDEQHLKTTMELFTTKKTETTLLTIMKSMFDSFICDANFNGTELKARQQLWLEIGKKVLCNTTDNFMPPAPIAQECTATKKAPSPFASDAEIACLYHNEVMGVTDNSNCEGL